MTDLDLATQVKQYLQGTTIDYPTWQKNVKAGKYSPKDGSGTAWGKAFATLAKIGAADTWEVALPGSTGQAVTTIRHPVGAGVNIHSATDPMTISDIVVIGGADQSFLVQPGAPGRTFQRIQSVLAVQDGASIPGNNKHGFYVKAPNTTVYDYTATASAQGDGGLSVRYAGFLGQRFSLGNFQLPLCIFADDEVKGSVTWRQGTITNPRDTPVYLDCDEASKMVYDVVVDQVSVTGYVGSIFAAANTANFAGTLTISNCTMNGQPVTASMIRGVPTNSLHIS